MDSYQIDWANMNTEEPPFEPETLAILLKSELYFDSWYRLTISGLPTPHGSYSGNLSCWRNQENITIKAKWKELGPSMTIWSEPHDYYEPDCAAPIPEPSGVIGIFIGILLLALIARIKCRRLNRRKLFKA